MLGYRGELHESYAETHGAEGWEASPQCRKITAGWVTCAMQKVLMNFRLWERVEIIVVVSLNCIARETVSG